MAINTNVVDRLSARIGLQDFEIFEADDFPAPVGGVITLPAGNYILKNVIVVADAFELAPGAIVGVVTPGPGSGSLIYTGTGALFRGTTGQILVLSRVLITLTEDGASLFDTTNFLITLQDMFITAVGAGALLGVVRNPLTTFTILTSLIQGFTNGLQLVGVPTIVVADSGFVSVVAGGTPLFFIDATSSNFQADNSTLDLDASQSLFAIDPSFVGFAGIRGIRNINASSFFSAGGLDETDPHVEVSNSDPQKSSMNIGSVVLIDNSVDTVIAAVDIWTDFNLNSLAALGSNAELWSLVSSTTGQLRYDGLSSFNGLLSASLSIVSAGGAQEFRFRAVKNGIPLENGVLAAREVGTVMGAVSLLVPAAIDPGDTVRLQVQNIDGSSNIVIRYMVIDIS